MDLQGLKDKLGRIKFLSNFKIPSSPEEKKALVYFLLLLFLFSAAAITSVVNFWWLNSTSDVSGEVKELPKMPTGGEVNARIAALSAKHKNFLRYRGESGELVKLAEAVGRYPVAALPPPVSEEFAVPEFPPQMRIKALVLMGGGSIATLDIENEGQGIIVRQGTVFGGGKGKITAIDDKGVSWTWSDKKYRTDL